MAAGGVRRKRASRDDGDREVANGPVGKREKLSKKGGKKGASRTARWQNRVDEEAELEELESRIVAEVPARGRAGAFEASDSAADGKDDGPALTQQLFSDLPISSRTRRGLDAAKYVKMTEIQRGAILRALAGRDILGEARTGSGKTLAFLVPLVELLFRRRWTRMDGLGALIVSPTRELAYQIFQVLASVGSQHDFSAGCIVGGRSLDEEQQAVATMNILVATPGRLLQHLDESPGFDASGLQMLVLDEADRILDFGFQETVQHILAHLPADRQTLLFSATLHASVQRLSKAALKTPEVVSVHRHAGSRTPERLKQVYMVFPLERKIDMLFSFLRSHSQKKIIVFVSACKQVRFLYEAFRKLKPGPSVMELHGRQSLTKRLVVFQEFMEREHTVALFCTDIAARGVDFPAVDWVVQMDCPDTVDSYIHRVGRTARYQSSGNSALFLLPSEQKFAEKLAAARVSVKCLAAKQNKLVSIQGKLSALLAGEPAIKHLAQKAFGSYVRSVALMKDKEVFDVSALNRDEFAQSMGLVEAPDLGGLDAEAELEKNPLKKQKNQTALQRLKERIKQKKLAKQAANAGGGAPIGAGADGGDASDDDLEADLEAKSSKKLGRWERRQRRLERQRAAAAAAATGHAASGAAGGAEDDLLELVDAGGGEHRAAASVASGLRKQKLKLGSDGKARDAQGKHTFFTGKEGRASTNELALIAEEIGDVADEPACEGSRAAFLQRVSRDLASRDASDVALSRARLQEKKRRRKEEERRGADDDDGGGGGPFVAQLASPTGSGGGEGGADDSDECDGGASPSSPDPPQPVTRGAKRRRAESAASAGGAIAATGQAAGPRADPRAGAGAAAAEDPLAAMERLALGRLGASLFA